MGLGRGRAGEGGSNSVLSQPGAPPASRPAGVEACGRPPGLRVSQLGREQLWFGMASSPGVRQVPDKCPWKSRCEPQVQISLLPHLKPTASPSPSGLWDPASIPRARWGSGPFQPHSLLAAPEMGLERRRQSRVPRLRGAARQNAAPYQGPATEPWRLLSPLPATWAVPPPSASLGSKVTSSQKPPWFPHRSPLWHPSPG